MMTVRVRRLFLAMLAGSLLTACAAVADAKKVLDQILALQAAISKGLPNENITVSENTDGTLTVSIVNSAMAQWPAERREAQTRRIAEFVRDHYTRYDKIQTVVVAFKSVKEAAGVTITSTDPTAYSVGELGTPGSAASVPPPVVPAPAPVAVPDSSRTSAAPPPADSASAPKRPRWNDLPK